MEYDLVVIGSGPAGQRAAVQAAKLGKRVAIVERNFQVGGVSVHTGTIPSKTIREAVLYLTGYKQRGFYGMAHREREVITPDDVLERVKITLSNQVEVMHSQLTRNGVKVVNGQARFIDANTLCVEQVSGEKRILKTRYVMLAVGTRPLRPAHIPFDGERIFDSDEVLHFKKMPRTLAVIGGGVIGVEFATVFSALDVAVTLIEARPTILDFCDREIIDEFQHQLRDQGMVLRLEEKVVRIDRVQDKVVVQLDSGKIVQVDMLLYAAGRVGATDTLDLEKAGLGADDRGRVVVNDDFQTAVPNIYAAGDIIGFPSLAATSMVQGRLAACHMFRHDYSNQLEFFPYGIYAVPEISMVGATEKELKDKQIPYETGVARFRELARGQILGLRDGILKMLFSIEDHRLLGVHIVGEGATELIHVGQAVITLGGTLEYFVDSAFNYPTLAEAYKVAALNAWNKLTPYKRLLEGESFAVSDASTIVPMKRDGSDGGVGG